MGNDIVKQQQNAVAGIELTQERINLIKRTVAVDATNDELAIFLHHARRTGLDPLSRQIYFIKRQGKMTIQTGIDGFRTIADRTGLYAGSDDPVYDEGLNQYQHIMKKRGLPTTSTVTVYKLVGGVRSGFTATAEWSAYYPGDKQGFMWKKMPYLMLGKCAESLALRKAFTQELSGVYTDAEMAQAGSGDSQPQKPQKAYTDACDPKTGEVVEEEIQPNPDYSESFQDGSTPFDGDAPYAPPPDVDGQESFTIKITGNSFKHKDALKDMGARWDKNIKAWCFYDLSREEAQDMDAKITQEFDGLGIEFI